MQKELDTEFQCHENEIPSAYSEFQIPNFVNFVLRHAFLCELFSILYIVQQSITIDTLWCGGFCAWMGPDVLFTLNPN